MDCDFMCLACDSRLHAAADRVWMCAVCQLAPATVTCDREIHSANLLARDTMLEAQIPAVDSEIKTDFFFDHFLDLDSLNPVQAETRFEHNPAGNLFKNSYTTQSLSLSVSSSSLEAGIVPESLYPLAGTMSSITDVSAANQATMQAARADREARVLRYKEKRKNRKFNKTIRYASRKANAETRPRIKGRFAKRIDSQREICETFSGIGIVPSNYGNF